MAIINGKALVKDGKPLDRVYSNGQLVYGRNYLMGTVNKNSTVGTGNNIQSKSLYKTTLSSLDALYKEFKKTSNFFTIRFDWVYTGTNPSGLFKTQWNMAPYDISQNVNYYTVLSNSNTSGTITFTDSIPISWSGVTATPYIGMRFDNVPTTGTITIYNMRLTSGNESTPHSPAPEDYI